MTDPPPARFPGRLLFVAANPSIDRTYELDRLVIGDIHRPRSTTSVPGGKGLNAARAAKTLGGTATTVGIVAGRAGDWIVERLAELGVDARMARTTGETRTCVSILDRSTGQLTEIYERGVEIDGTAWTALETIIRTELGRGDIGAVALSGSLPPGAPLDGYARIARIAADASPPIPILADASGPALAAVIAEHPVIVKLNAAEAGEASGLPITSAGSAADAAGMLIDTGATCVVVTLGLGGAVVVSAVERTHLSPPDVRGLYPVGSGDAFLGGLAVAYARGAPFVEAARLAHAAGIANAQIPGAGNLDPTTIDSILEQITSASI